ncbi:hypothetical protein D3P09_02730 [Paenibacillus pinisoli]|uniref:Uncharacterized protein n=1 Tax=Paenibacillus pinisoli TaxID=1276110 RepID=A0A3A6PVV6_9BACL|nr:hypothetical protein [Paenibacillus pinisoli]RJX40951.1 hypothetical protein D3P09_02730 [Paenibacillus pinisoli]
MLNNTQAADSIINKLHTQPIKFSYRFLKALFDIEQDYDNRVIYRTRLNGSGRLAHHVTKADLQLATTLQKFVNVNGELVFTNRHMIYQQLRALYEAPVNKDQFYAAFEKFQFNRLISTSPDSPETIKVILHSYLEPNGDLGRFVLYPSLITSMHFSKLPLSHQKFYYYACGQQGDQRGKILQINFDSLYELLHRQEPGHIRRILVDLASHPFQDQQPLLKVGRMETNMFGRPKAVYQVNGALLPSYIAGEHYRESMPIKKGIRRLLKRLEGYFLASGCDNERWYQPAFLNELAALIKGKSENYIKYVMGRVTKLGQGSLYKASEMLEIIKSELCDKAAGMRLAIAESTNVLNYLTGSKLEFGKSIRDIPIGTFRRICKQILPKLEKTYGRPAAYGTLDYKRPSVELQELEKALDLHTLRIMAFKQQLDPGAFLDLTQDAYRIWQSDNSKPSDLMNWLVWKMDELPKWRMHPDPPSDFDLFQFIQTESTLT